MPGVLVAVMIIGGCGGGDGASDEADGGATSTVPRTSSTSTTSSTTSSTSSTTSTTEAPAATTSSTAPAPTTSAPAGQEPATFTDPLDFFRSTEAACVEHAARVGNAAPEPQRFSGARVVDLVAFRVWLVEDGMGEEIVVDLEGGVVYSVDGPDAPLPIIYSFGCPENLYLGSHWD